MRKALLGFACLLFMLVHGSADAKTLTADQVKGILVDLGYEPAVDGDSISIENFGPSKNYLKFILTNEKQSLNIYTSWTVPPEKAGAIPAVDMLKANSSSPFIFAVFTADDKSLHYDLEATYDASLVNKVMLRKSMDQLTDVMLKNATLVDPDNWAAAK